MGNIADEELGAEVKKTMPNTAPQYRNIPLDIRTHANQEAIKNG